MANRYETVFILTPVLSEDQIQEAVEKMKGFLKDKKAKIHHEENWGLRKLAYPIQKKTTGFYNLLEFEGDGDVLPGFEETMKRDERFLRFLTVKMDKHHIEYAENRRDRYKKKKSKKAEEAEQEK